MPSSESRPWGPPLKIGGYAQCSSRQVREGEVGGLCRDVPARDHGQGGQARGDLPQQRPQQDRLLLHAPRLSDGRHAGSTRQKGKREGGRGGEARSSSRAFMNTCKPNPAIYYVLEGLS